MPEMEALVELQELDIKVRRLEEQDRENNADLRRKQEEAAALEASVASAEAKERSLAAQVHDKTVDRDALKESLERYQTQRNEVRKPRELVAIDKEIETTLKAVRQAEAEIQKLQEELATVKAEVETAREKLRLKREEIGLIESRNAEQNAKNSEALAEARRARDEVMKRIPPDLLETYRFISSNKDGVALAEVSGGACGACFITLPPQAINEIRRGDRIIRCSSCSRILYIRKG